jgi:hypothetical protein
MIYAAIVVCHLQGCLAVTDGLGPYETQDACLARLEEIRAAVVAAFAHVPGARMRAVCGTVDEVRQLIPGAFPGVPAGVLL